MIPVFFAVSRKGWYGLAHELLLILQWFGRPVGQVIISLHWGQHVIDCQQMLAVISSTVLLTSCRSFYGNFTQPYGCFPFRLSCLTTCLWPQLFLRGPKPSIQRIALIVLYLTFYHLNKEYWGNLKVSDNLHCVVGMLCTQAWDILNGANCMCVRPARFPDFLDHLSTFPVMERVMTSAASEGELEEGKI